ncbi:MAG: SCO6745 family protein, partial [Acidimicrobiales bacterium]
SVPAGGARLRCRAMTPEELVAAACPRINNMGWAFYFVPGTVARGAELGLDGVTFYVLGRGGVLGDVDAPVIASAFGYFNPALVESAWNAGRAIVAPRTAGRAFMECSAALGREKFGAVNGLDAFCAAAGAVHAAADPVGLPLYAGVSTEPLVEDAPGRAMQLVTVLREFRGSAHMLALRASGLAARTAHAIKRPDDGAMFGWAAEDAPVVTAEDRATWTVAEHLTDRIVLPAFAVLDEAGGRALLGGLDGIEKALAAT